MAPDQESSSGQVVKPPDNLCEEENEAKSPLDDGEPINGCIVKDSGGGSPEDAIPDIDPCNLVHLEWFQVHRIGAGLANLGNSCFLNTVIQCLTYCPPLANYLLQNDHSSSCQSFEFCMMCELQKHIKEVLERSGDVIKPVHIYDNLKFIAEHFESGQQEDAHEFLRFVIENLWRASLYNYTSEQVDPTVRETTVINYIFGGYNRSQVVCLRCKKRSNTYEHFMDFILDIKHNANSLEKALEHYVKPEILDKDNAYNCPQCNTLVPAEKTYSIHRAPNVATIQLKRFDYNKVHGGKITKHVSYPEQLDLRPFMSEKTDHPLWYKLNAVLVHVGQNCNSGHYYCYIRNSNGHWYLMDDARVQRVGLNDVLNQQAYLLFYVRVPDAENFKEQDKPLPCINGSSPKNGTPNGIKRSPSAERPSTFNSRKKKIFMPYSKWVSSNKNYWNHYRKPSVTKGQGYNAVRRQQNSHLSSPEDNSSHSSWSSGSSSRSNGRSNDSPSKHNINIRLSFNNQKRYNSDTADNHSHLNGKASPKNSNDSESPSPQPHYRHNSDNFQPKSSPSKNYSPFWKSNSRRYGNESRRNSCHGYSRGYGRPPSSFNRNFNRSASDTNLYVDSDYYNLPPDNNGDGNCSWKPNREAFGNGPQCGYNWEHNHEESCRNETYSQEYANRWGNRNGFRYNQPYAYKNNKDNNEYRKFHEKSRSADFSFSRPRFYPYYHPKRQTQECF